MTNNKVELRFIHPHSSKHFIAEVSLQCTGQQAIQGLLLGDTDGPFLSPAPAGRPYELILQRTQQAITPNMTLAQVGAISGDIIEVRQAGQGATIFYSYLN
ncbi:MAG: hypothetical protein HYR87_01975 [Thaumarchaeota archaeon]|nr:hypothetical protein [Nitrososphaerota archaeon]